ncbi:MAG: hypothetical protein Q8P49_02895 [Candidatus Liptonbacteria bacterium]|nr:hypothetical protein [Candidatus Liptonbacteria bacterium]
MIPWKILLEFLGVKLAEFEGTDFGQIQFESRAWAIGMGISLIVLLALKLIFPRKKYARAHSGHSIPVGFRKSFSAKTIRVIPKCIVAAGAFFLLIAIAKPFLPATKKIEFVESRERIDLQDVSRSTGWEFAGSGKSVAQILREAHLQFLKLRRGQHDRVSYWLFADHPYKIEDFIMDDEAYLFQIFAAPYLLLDPGYKGDVYPPITGDDSLWRSSDPYIVVPPNKIQWVAGESGTDLKYALVAVIKYFDERGDRKIKRRSLLLMTDAAIDSYPSDELDALRKRRIIPYIIWVRPNEEKESYSHRENAARLIREIPDYGGKVYPAADTGAIKRAYEDINRLEKARVRVERHTLAPTLFQRFSFVGVMLMCAGLVCWWIVEMRWGEYP